MKTLDSTPKKKVAEVVPKDAEPVLVFLNHLGVSRQEVHERITDTLQKKLEDEIRKTTNEEALLHLLENCWKYAATDVPKIRPILWGVLKKLGDKTPLNVLRALAEEDGQGKQKYEDIFRPLPPLLKQLVWEADWDHKIPIEKENIDNSSEYSSLVQSTLLYKTVNPLVEEYMTNSHLRESAKKVFATSLQERRILTTERRTVAQQSTTTKSTTPINADGTGNSTANDNSLSSGKAVSRIRDLLSDSSSGSILCRPKLLHGVLSMLMMKHGADSTTPAVLTSAHLHCTLVADILLSAGGSLPKIYQPLLALARALDFTVKNGVFSANDLIKVQRALKQIFAADEENTSSGFSILRKLNPISADEDKISSEEDAKMKAKKLNMVVEVQKRTEANDAGKRNREGDSPSITPLQPMNKRRKLNLEENSLSMPTLACMLLSDPFVVRLLLDHVLRSLRVDVVGGTSIPATHKTIPSTLQILHIAQWSRHFCHVRGKRYLVPDAGLMKPKESFDEAIVPYDSLRRFLPLIVHLLLEAMLEKRLSPAGDLVSVAKSSLPRPPVPVIEPRTEARSHQVAVALLQGAYVYACLPGNSQETSLALTFSKFSRSLLSLLPNLWNEESFFACLVPSILRHKTRLKGPVRDAILSSWIEWLSCDPKANEKKSETGSILSPAHEYLLILLSEWSKFGNALVSRDILLQFIPRIVVQVNATESNPNRHLSSLWQSSTAGEDFGRIKKHYENILALLPDDNDSSWLCKIGR